MYIMEKRHSCYIKNELIYENIFLNSFNILSYEWWYFVLFNTELEKLYIHLHFCALWDLVWAKFAVTWRRKYFFHRKYECSALEGFSLSLFIIYDRKLIIHSYELLPLNRAKLFYSVKSRLHSKFWTCMF